MSLWTRERLVEGEVVVVMVVVVVLVVVVVVVILLLLPLFEVIIK